MWATGLAAEARQLVLPMWVGEEACGWVEPAPGEVAERRLWSGEGRLGAGWVGVLGMAVALMVAVLVVAEGVG